jgi:hypothetical protein
VQGAKRAALAILIIAVMAGAALRFYRLGAEEMNRGEAAAWSAAVAPDLRSVFIASKHYDPGKSGIYDLVLHLWIRVVGDQVGPMRSLSAILGTLAIALLFAAVREVFRVFDDESSAEATWYTAAFAALLYACNYQMISLDRITRMYPLMLVAIFGQIWCFARAHRRASPWVILGAAMCTDIAVSANFTSLFFFLAEALWLAYVWLRITRNPDGARGASELSMWWPLAALILAGVLFLPIGITDARIAVTTLHAGVLAAIEPRPPWWPIRALQVMTGNAAFWPMLLLSIFGVWTTARQGLAVRFILCWMVLPFAILELISLAITPMMVERYALASLVAYLVLTAVGLGQLPGGVLRYLVAGFVIVLSLAHVHHHWRAPEDVQWREAARFAVQAAPDGQKIVVIPEEPVMVLRYYLPADSRSQLVAADAKLDESRHRHLKCGPEPVVIASTELPAEFMPQLNSCYPRLLARFRLVEVRGR